MIYSITEGQQAEEYKARKAKEAEAESKKYDKYDITKNIGGRIAAGNRDAGIYVSKNDHSDFRIGSKEDNDRSDKSTSIVKKELDARLSRAVNSIGGKEFTNHNSNLANLSNTKAMHAATDAINRHMRRHPDQYKESCGIFSNVAFI